MLTKHNYCPLPTDWDRDLKDCCPDTPAGDPGSPDCCYQSWNSQLLAVNRNLREADEKAKRLQRQLDSAILFRDKYKAWFEDFSKANDLANYICQHMQVFAAQIENICCSTKSSIDAINLLYCMVRDFYIRVDLLKDDYDRLINCIKCLNRPEMNGGIMDCLAAYYKKLEAVVATRDRIIELLVKATKIAYEVNASICSKYGLQRTMVEWQQTFNCEYVESGGAQHYEQNQSWKSEKDCTLPETCMLVPMLSFPFEDKNSNSYYTFLQQERTRLDSIIKTLGEQLVTANKEKEILLTNKDNLIKAIQEVDPKNKCK